MVCPDHSVSAIKGTEIDAATTPEVWSTKCHTSPQVQVQVRVDTDVATEMSTPASASVHITAWHSDFSKQNDQFK